MYSKIFTTFRRFPPVAVILLLAGLFAPAFADDKHDPPKPVPESPETREDLQKTRESLDQLREEHAKLKKENALLRRENQQLRRLLADKREPGASAAATTNTVGVGQTNLPTNESGAEADSPLTYWFSTTSGKRHNSRCRYFSTTEGRRCGPEEGKACKLCGG
jgi:hypothetical protein